MSKQKVIVLPWHRPNAYFALIDEKVVQEQWNFGSWERKEEDFNADGMPERVTVRTRNTKRMVVRVDWTDSRDATNNMNVFFDYDSAGRVVRVEVKQPNRPKVTTYTYEYDIRDRLVKETKSQISSSGNVINFTAKHLIGAKGIIASTIVTDHEDRTIQIRHFAPWGGITSDTCYDRNGIVFTDDRFVFDRHRREIGQISRQYIPDSASGQARLCEETVVNTTFRPRSTRPTLQHSIIFYEFEVAPGNFKWIKKLEEKTVFAPVRGGVQRFESVLFNPDENGDTTAESRRSIESVVDTMGRVTECVEVNTTLATGESKTLRTVCLFGSAEITTMSTDGDPESVQETITVCDAAGHLLASRTGKPDEGPFTTRQTLRYNQSGELVERRMYEHNSNSPTRIVRYS